MPNFAGTAWREDKRHDLIKVFLWYTSAAFDRNESQLARLVCQKIPRSQEVYVVVLHWEAGSDFVINLVAFSFKFFLGLDFVDASHRVTVALQEVAFPPQATQAPRSNCQQPCCKRLGQTSQTFHLL